MTQYYASDDFLWYNNFTVPITPTFQAVTQALLSVSLIYLADSLTI